MWEDHQGGWSPSPLHIPEMQGQEYYVHSPTVHGGDTTATTTIASQLYKADLRSLIQPRNNMTSCTSKLPFQSQQK